MSRTAHPYLERRSTGYYFRRRLPAAAGNAPSPESAGEKSGQTASVCLSLRTHFLRDAKALALRLTAVSDALFATRTEQDMAISAEMIGAILKAVRDHEVSAHERTRARAPERSPAEVEAALSREEAIQEALRDAIALGKRDTAAPLLQAAANRLGMLLNTEDPDFPVLSHKATRLLVEISAERARREAGDYGVDSVLEGLTGTRSCPTTPTFQSRRAVETAGLLATAFGQDAAPTSLLPTGARPLPARGLAEIRSGTLLQGDFGAPEASPSPNIAPAPNVTPAIARIPVAVAPHQTAAAQSGQLVQQAAPRHPSLVLPAEPEARHRALLRAIPDLRIDKTVFSEASLEALLDPWNMTISEAFDAYFEVKLAGYGDEFHKTQKRLPKSGQGFSKNTKPSMTVARRLWCDLLGNCRLNEVTNDNLDKALQLLARLPVLNGKAIKGDTIQEIIDKADALEIENDAAASREIEDNPDLTEAEKDQLRLDAEIPRLRAETYLKHGRAMGRIGRFLEGLGLLPYSPFGLCSWTQEEEETMRANEETKAREPWDDRIYTLFRTPVFQGECDGPGDPLFWAPLISTFDGPRMEEILQLAPEDFGSEGGIPYFRISNRVGNNVKSTSGDPPRICGSCLSCVIPRQTHRLRDRRRGWPSLAACAPCGHGWWLPLRCLHMVRQRKGNCLTEKQPLADWSYSSFRVVCLYRPVSASISARDLRARSVADFNCPQAAMMSSPRGVRMGLA